MEENENEVVESAETATDEELLDNSQSDESTGEDEDASETKSTKQQSTETPEQRKARIKRMYEREFGKQGKEGSEKGGQESDKEEKVEDEKYTRLSLEVKGVTSKKAQDIVLEYIKEARLVGKEVDVTGAMKSMVVKEAIAELEKNTSAPAPSKRTGSGASDTFEYWVGQAKKGNFPRGDKAMMKKLQKARVFSK